MKKGFKVFGIYFVILAIVLAMVSMYDAKPKEKIEKVTYSTFVEYIAKEEAKEVKFQELTMTALLKDGKTIQATAHSSLDMDRLHTEYLDKQILEKKVKVDNIEPEKESILVALLPTLIMVGALILFWVLIMRQQGGGGKAMSFGKSRARLQDDKSLKKLTFKDVAGLDEEKEELEEIVDFLKHPKKYHNLGARIPKGILLVGPPGTGKTYISKATAGEAGVPFFTISGSDFVEMFVGVGASRVRDLFEQAKKNAPCIIFIDEIDAVGRKRGAGMGGGHDEREQTLNQLLVEMDGFAEHLGIIILAATNRPDILDPALLRPGRFDRQIVIGAPDVKGREEIFKVHSKNKPLDKEVDPKVLARRTPGFTPADIENMLNEAALLTARRNGSTIHMEEIEEAITKVIAGPEKKSRVISEKERYLTAIHEAGHGVVAHCLPDTDPVHQITIVPRGRAGGFTMILPREDRYYNTKGDMEESIVHLLGGRVAEMLVLSDISTGASNDIQRATDIARDMVTKYGFSEKLGPINYSSSEEVFLGKDFGSKQSYSEETANEIDEEVKRIVHEGYERAQQILIDNRDKLLAVADALMELETIDGDQFERIFSGEATVEMLVKELEEKEAKLELDKQKEEEFEEPLFFDENTLAKQAEEMKKDDDDEEATVEEDSTVDEPHKSEMSKIIEEVEAEIKAERDAIDAEIEAIGSEAETEDEVLVTEDEEESEK